MERIYAVIYIVLSILIFNLISCVDVHRKKLKIISTNQIYLSHKKHSFINNYLNKIESKLFNLGYPYKLNAKKYLILKYILSTIIFIIAIFNYKDIKIAIIISLISFFIPNYLIRNYRKNEKYLLINQIKKITTSLILSLSSYSSLEYALNIASRTIDYVRLKLEFDKFIYEYKMSGYNLKQASKRLESKFDSYEMSLFVGVLIQGNEEGSLLENLQKFANTLEINYFKYLKKKSAERLVYVSVGTILSLINIILVVMYPIFSQVMNNLQMIFN